MLELKEITPQAMVEIKPLLAVQKYRSCDYSVGGIYMWREFFGELFTVADNMLICTADYFDDGFCYTMPVGTGSLENALELIRRDSTCRNTPLRFCCITEQGLKQLCAVLGEPLLIKDNRKWADYLYPYENFLGYHGKKLVTPRNHCNRFLRDYPQYTYEPISLNNIALDAFRSLIPMGVGIYVRYTARDEGPGGFELFDFSGGILKVDGRVIGVTVGEVIGDTLYVQIEKALTSYSGAYPMLAQLYAKQMAREGLSYINREDDSGDPGLRHSKLEYRPCELITKYTVEF